MILVTMTTTKMQYLNHFAIGCVSISSRERVNGLRRKLSKPRFRHYPLNPGLGFLELHRRPMTDSI